MSAAIEKKRDKSSSASAPLIDISSADKTFDATARLARHPYRQENRLPLGVCWGIWLSISALLWMLILDLAF